VACLMVSGRGGLPGRSWLASLFGHALTPADRRCLLVGARSDAPDPGPTVCACFSVGANTIRTAIQGGCDSVEAVGRALKAGTNCGSCRPEIARLVSSEAREAATQRAAAPARVLAGA
jgi:assimilatory nitrate reductase catalytic subunit